MSWQTKKLGDKEYFEILGVGIDYFENEKDYISTSSIEKNKIILPESKITYKKRPSRANMQPKLNSVWFARMQNTIKVYSFTEENKEEVDKYILSTGFCGILCSFQKVFPKYVEKIFISNWFNKIKDSMASDKAIQKSLNNKDVENLSIPLPPLPIQQKIVFILDTIEKAIEIQEKIIEKTKELKKSLMTNLFKFGGPSFRKNIKLKKTEIGEIPENWKVVRLGKVCEKPQYGLTASAFDENTGIRLLRITDIQEEKVNWESVPFCKCTKIDFKKYKLLTGDILVARIGATTGKTYLVKNPPPAVFGSYLIRVRSKTSLNNYFLQYYFQLNLYWAQINLAKGGKLKGGINLPIIENLKFPLAPLPEQQEIVEILQTIDKKIEIEERKKALYEELFSAMLDKLMKGEIDVENINFD